MNARWRLAAVLVSLVLVSGCAAMAHSRRFTNEAEAVAALGEPGRRWANDDGTTTLEYATQPYGESTLMLTVDGSGRVLRQENALAADNLARVALGMTREQVARLLGRHRSVQVFALSGEEVWDWNIGNDGPATIATLFNVHFIDGRVVRTSRSYEYPRELPSMRLKDPGFRAMRAYTHVPRVPYRWHHGWPYQAWYGW